LELGFLNPYRFFDICKEGNNYVAALKKEDEAIENWHSKALLIDLRKTRITIVNT
jgi:hypothetical protein